MARLALLFVFVSGQAFAFNLATDSKGDVVRWRGQVEFVLDQHFAEQLGLPPSAMEAVEQSVKTYDAATTVLKVSVRRGEPVELGYSQEPGATNQNVIIVADEWAYAPAAVATTLVTVRVSSKEMLDADIVFNADGYDFDVVGETGDGHPRDARSYDVQNTVMHELGHALGLAHNADDSSAVMFPGAQPQETKKRKLSADDEAGLVELYAVDTFSHPELLTGCSSAPGSSGSWLALVLGLWMLLRLGRPRLAAVAKRATPVLAALVVVGAGTASAAEPNKEAPAPPEEVAWAEVVDAHARWLPGTHVIVTDVEVEVRTCVRGECPKGRVVVQVLGGRVGDIEQLVAHQPPVVKGSQVLLARKGTRRVVVPTTLSATTPALSTTR